VPCRFIFSGSLEFPTLIRIPGRLFGHFSNSRISGATGGFMRARARNELRCSLDEAARAACRQFPEFRRAPSRLRVRDFDGSRICALAGMQPKRKCERMSFEFAYRFKQDAPRSRFRDLDDVVLLAAAVSDDGDTIPAGTEGTIVSVHGDGTSYAVEFAEPEGALVTVLPQQIRAVTETAR
jgi:hypothetical protein